MEEIETATPRDPSATSLSVDNTVIAKLNSYPTDNYSYFSENGIRTNIEKDRVVPVMFGIDGSEYNANSFYAAGYKNEGFIETAQVSTIPSECLSIIRKFDEGIIIDETGKVLTKITTNYYPEGLPNYQAPSSNEEIKQHGDNSVRKMGNVNLAYLTYMTSIGGEEVKYSLAVPFKGDTLYIGVFYVAKYTNGNLGGYNKKVVDFRGGIFFDFDSWRFSTKRSRNAIASSFGNSEIPDSAKLIGCKTIYSKETRFNKDKVISDKGYAKYFSLFFDGGEETCEIGFKVNADKYFYPTVIDYDGNILFHVLGDKSEVKYYSCLTRIQSNITKGSLKNTITAFYMNDQPSKLEGNDVWAPRSTGGNSYPIRYLKTSQSCYFKLGIKANTEKDPEKVSDGTWKEFTICSSGFDDSFKNAMVREWKTWKRYDGRNFEYGGDKIAAYDPSTKMESSAKVEPVELLSAGTTINSDDKLYEVLYKKVSTEDIWFGAAAGDPCLYVKNGKLYDGNNRECALGNPFENAGEKMSSKFASLSVLKGHEGGAIEYFYTCQAGVVTYGVGFTWQSAKKENEGEMELWRKFFTAARNMNDIKISLKDTKIKSFNTKDRTNATNELYQEEIGGQIFFRKISTNEKLKVYPWNGNTLLPIVKVPPAHIETKFEALAVEYAERVYKETILPIETVKSPDGGVGERANVNFDTWVGDQSGKYTIRSRITQEQWDYMVDARYQGNGDFFKHLRGGTSVDSGTGVKCTYREFCQRALNGIEYENAYQEEHPDKNYFLRNREWRNGPLQRVFSNIPPEEAEPSASNDQDNVKYYVHDITISCHSLGRGKIDTVMLDSDSGNNGVNPRAYITRYSKKAVGPHISENEKDAVYYITSYYEEDSKSDAIKAIKVTQDQMDWGRFKDIVNRWSCKITEEGNQGEQALIGVDRYYDFYSGMTPFVQAYFREIDDNNNATWNILNSLQHPYFKSLVVEDKGVKTATLTLFDKDFGSYQYGIVIGNTEDASNLDGVRYTNSTKWENVKEGGVDKSEAKSHTLGKKVYSLETIIKKSLVQNAKNDLNRSEKSTISQDTSDGAGDGNNYKDFTEEELKDTYLKYDEYKSADPTNLKLRFGYADDNPPVSQNQFKGDSGESKSQAYNTMKYNGNTNNKRDYRWYDVRWPGIEKAIKVNPKVYFDGSKILENNGNKVSIIADDTMTIDNSNKVELDEEVKNNKHKDLTTLRSYVRNYMIIGYETSLKPNGIQYTIKAVETGYASLMRKRFLQRYHELTSNPIEVLAALMTIFNEPQQGKPNTKSGFKLYYAVAHDENAENAADTLNMLFDFGNLSDADRNKYSWAKDSYTVNTSGGDLSEFGRDIYKKITVKLGGESALGNMARPGNYGKPALYKSVASLMDEFCSACPSKRFGNPSKDTKAYDKDGNEITNDTYVSQARLGWFLGKCEGGGKENEQCVVLYYKHPRKLKRIRVYRWGPELPFKTVVKSLSVKNNNEFAVLSAVDTFKAGPDGAQLRCKINARNMAIADVNNTETKLISKDLSVVRSFSDLSEKLDTEGAEIAGYIASNEREANQYDLAFSSSMYTGTMEILGDPSIEFNMLLQPYTYPIRLEVYVPRNELAFKSMNWGISDIEGEDEKNAQKANNKANLYEKMKDAEEKYGARENLGLHQVHEMSGYYVITSITHNISVSGYTTTLGIASYPNIENDVLDFKDGKPRQPSYLTVSSGA